jgi:hypothetical protein
MLVVTVLTKQSLTFGKEWSSGMEVGCARPIPSPLKLECYEMLARTSDLMSGSRLN